MSTKAGATIGLTACLLLLITLVWAYVTESVRDVTVYYNSGAINPLLAGILVIGVLLMFAASHKGDIAEELGAGIILGLALVICLITIAWATTARVDVFRAPGWAFPAQRWILVGLSMLLLLGAIWHTWVLGLLSITRSKPRS